MSDIAVCTDSSSLVPAADADRLGIEVVPIAITLHGEPFDERMHSIDDFYERLDEGEATTSQPNPGEFAAAYERLAERGARRVLSIHLDARVSGTTASAELAAKEASIPVRVVDTRTVSFGVGACVRAAAEEIEAGASLATGAAKATHLGAAMRNAFVARSGPGGRIPELPGWAVLTFADGTTLPVAECDRIAEAVDEMAAQVLRSDAPVRAAVGHAGEVVEATADTLADMLARSPMVLDVQRYRVGAAVGAHTGPVSFGVFWWPVAS